MPADKQPEIAGNENPDQPTEFERAGEQPPLSLVQEFYLFVTENKKWWMIPILLVLGLLGVLVAFSSTGAAPFIYTLF
jgi:hypothetical protein